MPNIYFVTGASSDIGRLLIERLLESGTPQDIVIAQGLSSLEGIAPLAIKYKGQVRTYSVDLTDPFALDAFLKDIEKNIGIPTHFIHLPALRVVNTKYKNFDEAHFNQDLKVQVGSAIAITKRFVPQMAKQKRGRVLFMLSSYVLGAPPKNTAAYVMAKQALEGLAKSLAVEYASSGVTVNCVAPSMVETKFLEDTPRLIVEASAEANPMGRNATPEDVVPAMQFLLSEDAGFITGVVLPITGGSVL